MDNQEISLKNTKKEILDAYLEILKEIGEKQNSQTILEENKEEKIVLHQASELNMDKVRNDIDNLKISVADILNKLTDKLSEELKKMNNIKQAISIESGNLENVYRLKAEAQSLFDLIALREQKKAEFQKIIAEEEQKLQTDIEQKKRRWQREEEEYVYQLQIKRKKEQDDYEFKKSIQEREFNEKNTNIEKALKIKEEAIAAQESEIKNLKTKTENFSVELEKAKIEAARQIKEEMAHQNKIEKELAAKDEARERDIAKLRIASLEETIKKQTTQIQSLEARLLTANQKAQELAVKIIESRSAERSQKDNIDYSETK